MLWCYCWITDIKFCSILPLGITYVAYGSPQVVQGVNQPGYVISQPGYHPGQMTYAVGYNAATAMPQPQQPSKFIKLFLVSIWILDFKMQHTEQW